MPRRPLRIALWPALCACLGLGGCSWLFVKPLPEDYRNGDPIECTTSPVPPILDTLQAASDLAGALYVGGKVGDRATSTQNAFITSALTFTVMYTFAAIHGYRATAACRAALDEDEGPIRRPWSTLQPRPQAAPPAPKAPGQPDDEVDPNARSRRGF